MAKKRTTKASPKKAAPKPKQPRKRSKPDWTTLFLSSLALTANIKAAAAAAKVNRRTVYRRRDDDPAFAAAMSDALEDAVDDLELEARRRAYEGCEKAVYGSGGAGVGTVEVGRIREYSDTLMIFLLKAHRPEKYRERFEVKHAGRVEVGLAETMTDDELARIAREGEGKPS